MKNRCKNLIKYFLLSVAIFVPTLVSAASGSSLLISFFEEVKETNMTSYLKILPKEKGLDVCTFMPNICRPPRR